MHDYLILKDSACNTVYTVILAVNFSESFQPFRGFLIQGRQRADDNTVLGTFMLFDTFNTRFSNCSLPEVSEYMHAWL